MVDQSSARRSSGLLVPVIGGVALIAAIVAGIFFRVQLWDFLKWFGRTVTQWVTVWVPDHPKQSLAILGFAVVAFGINWVAHVRGRFRAWIFALVVEAGLWTIFWYGPGIPSLNDLTGLHLEQLPAKAVGISGAVVIAVTGAIFWFLEAREEWRRYRRQHTVEDS